MDALEDAGILGLDEVRVPGQRLSHARAVLQVAKRKLRESAEKQTAERKAADQRLVAEQEAERQRVRTEEEQRRLPELRQEQRRRRQQARESDWKIVGRPEPLIHLTPGDLEAIHYILVDDFRKSRDPIDPPGVRDRKLLESAAFRPHTAIGETEKYPTVAMAAAALFHAVVHDHAFFNGNKRTALVALLVFLDKNGYILSASQDELFDYVLAIARHRILPDIQAPGTEFSDRESIAISRWLQGRIRRVRSGELCIKFRELRRILTNYECRFDVVPKGRINIIRNGRQTQTFYGGEGRDVWPEAIHRVRKDLGLTEDEGYDSDIFYNASPKIPDFIVKYRRALDRLAKM